MEEENSDYFELGRGAKLVANEYWHQYVLGVDLAKKKFIAKEIGKTGNIHRKEISFDDLRQSAWTEFLDVSKTKPIAERIFNRTTTGASLDSLFESIFQIVAQKELFHGDWISIKEYDRLDYNSNFGNWVDAFPRKGYVKLAIDLHKEGPNCSVGIPVNYYNTIGEGYYSIVRGRFQLGYSQLLVWQNDTFPVMIAYELRENMLTLDLFKTRIDFRRNES